MDNTQRDARLALWAQEAAQEAQAARAAEDERALSLALMKKNMYETMLPELMHRAPGKLSICADEMTRRAEAHRARGDYDSANRCEVQREAIQRVQALMEDNI